MLRSEPQERAGQLNSQSPRPMILRQAAFSKRWTDRESCDTIWRSSRSLLCTQNGRSEKKVGLLHVRLHSDSSREIVSKGFRQCRRPMHPRANPAPWLPLLQETAKLLHRYSTKAVSRSFHDKKWVDDLQCHGQRSSLRHGPSWQAGPITIGPFVQLRATFMLGLDEEEKAD
jgi:hypothetical protein